MKKDITPLITSSKTILEIDEKILIDESYYENTEIIRLDEIHIKGFIKKIYETYELVLNIKGNMVIPCAISLEEVNVSFDVNIEEEFGDGEDNLNEILKIFENSIDIMPVIWQNIELEIPLRVVSPNADSNLSGDGWKLISEDE